MHRSLADIPFSSFFFFGDRISLWRILYHFTYGTHLSIPEALESIPPRHRNNYMLSFFETYSHVGLRLALWLTMTLNLILLLPLPGHWDYTCVLGM